MLDKISKSKLPREYDYNITEWSINLKSDIFQYKRKLIITSILFAMTIPLIFFVSDLYAGKTNAFFNYTIPFFLLLIQLFYTLKNKNSNLIINITMSVAFAGFFLAAFLPYSRQVSLLILITFIPFAFFLAGTKQGILWSLIFLFTVVSTFLFSHLNIIPNWNLYFSEYHEIMIAIAILTNFLILLMGQSQSDRHLRNMIKHLVFDDTTGLPNKNTMLNSYPKNQNFILAIIRIQNFNELSSLFGYEIAEKILLFAAQTISEISARDGFNCFKLLGHEFGLIIPEVNESFSEKNAERILNNLWIELQSIKLSYENKEYYPIYRIGATIVSSNNTEKALSGADIALNMAQRFLYNVYIHKEFSNDRLKVLKSNQLYTILLDNIKNNKLKILYQPIVNTITGETGWYEALLRVRLHDGTLESIFKYLPMAKNTGLYNELTRFLLKNIKKTLLETEHDISINITLSDITHPDFMEEVISICEAIKDKKSNLIIEIIESEELVEVNFCRNFIKAIQELGCKVAIDDFGSGYSNFSMLFNLSIDIVKIDGSLMRSIEHDKNALNMIESITSFCHKSGKVIVAEYIENKNLHELAQNYNIHFCQGYYFGKPAELLPDKFIDTETSTFQPLPVT